MGFRATVSAVFKNPLTVLFGPGVPVPGARRGAVSAKGTRHVDLDAGAHHPLLVGDEPRAVALSPGKAVLQQVWANHLTATPIKGLLDAMPPHPALAPLHLVGELIRGAAGGENRRVVVAEPNMRPGGYVITPQEPPFFPGGAPVSERPHSEGYLADPAAMQSATEGKLPQHWAQMPEQLIPIGAKWSDFVYLADDKQFNEWMKSIAGHAEKDAANVRGLTDPELVQQKAWSELLTALNRQGARGPNVLAGQVARFDGKGAPAYVYMPPTVTVLGEPLTVAHPDVKGFNNYGVLGAYIEKIDALTVDINSDFPDLPQLKNYWGSGDAMMKELMHAVEYDGFKPRYIYLRPSKLQTATGLKWGQSVNSLIQERDKYTPGTAPYRQMEGPINASLTNIEGMSPILAKGYKVVRIGVDPSRGMTIFLEKKL